MSHDTGSRSGGREAVREDPRPDAHGESPASRGSDAPPQRLGFGGRLLGWRRRTGPLTQRLAEQGLLLFRWRSYFGFLLLPGAVLAVLGRRGAEQPLADSLLYFAACLLVTLAGLAIRFAALASAAPGTSGRDTQQPRAKTLNTTGLYSVVRHPIYLGNLIVLVGFTMTLRVAWFVVFAVLVYWLLYERVIAAEERFLAERFGERFRLWAAVTPVFLPDFALYKPASWTDDFWSVVRKEQNSLCIVAWMFLALRLFERTVASRMTPADWGERDLWAFGLLLGVVAIVETYRHWLKLQRRRSRKSGESGA